MRPTATAIFIFTLPLGCLCSSAAGPTDGPTVLKRVQIVCTEVRWKTSLLLQSFAFGYALPQLARSSQVPGVSSYFLWIATVG
jgi:hypothetical protein